MANIRRPIRPGVRCDRRRRFPAAGRAAVILPALAMVTVAGPVSGQVRIGGQGVYRNELLSSGFGFGARVELDLGFVMPELGLGGVYNRFSTDCPDCVSWEAGGQVTLGEGMGYIGFDVLLSRFEALVDEQMERTDDWKFSLVVGFRMRNVPIVVPFLEARQSLGSGVLNDQALSLGVLIGPARARQAPRRRAPR